MSIEIHAATFTLTATATDLDLWRLNKFGTTDNTGNAADSADPDGDAQPNISEHAAGTDPNIASDVFKVLTTTKDATSFTVTASGKASRTYVLERCNSPGAGVWMDIRSVGPLAADGPIRLSDPAPPAGAGFYRIRVSAP